MWFRHWGILRTCGLDTSESWAHVWFRHREVFCTGVDTGESWAQVWFRHRGVLPRFVNVKWIKIVTLIEIVIKLGKPRYDALPAMNDARFLDKNSFYFSDIQGSHSH